MFKVRPILALSAAFLLPTSAAGLQAQEQVGAGGDRPVRVSFSDSPELSEGNAGVSKRMLSSGTSTQTTSRPILAFRASRFGSGPGITTAATPWRRAIARKKPFGQDGPTTCASMRSVRSTIITMLGMSAVEPVCHF